MECKFVVMNPEAAFNITTDEEIMTEEETIRAAMRLLGMKTSKRKAESSRRNGKLAWSKKRKAQAKNSSK